LLNSIDPPEHLIGHVTDILHLGGEVVDGATNTQSSLFGLRHPVQMQGLQFGIFRQPSVKLDQGIADAPIGLKADDEVVEAFDVTAQDFLIFLLDVVDTLVIGIWARLSWCASAGVPRHIRQTTQGT